MRRGHSSKKKGGMRRGGAAAAICLLVAVVSLFGCSFPAEKSIDGKADVAVLETAQEQNAAGGTDLVQEEASDTEQPGRMESEENVPQTAERQTAEAEEDTTRTAEELEVHFLDVGQGDATLLLCGGEAMLIDAGGNDQGTKIQNYLRKQGVEDLKYVVCTHPDEDHIGGMDVILYKFNCGKVFMTQEEKDTDTYRDVADTMSGKGYKRSVPAAGEQFTLGDAVFTILGPVSESSDSNNNSIVLLLTHGENRFLFTGDAQEEEEKEIVDGGILPDADVYKAGHHGSRTSSCEELLDAVSPLYAVISCGEGNAYGHPHAETMNRLRSMGVQVFRTDEQGTVVVNSDGEQLVWNCAPSETWKAGEPGRAPEAVPETEAQVAEEGTDTAESAAYICNRNTKKFHYPDCDSVRQMKEENKLPMDCTREDLIGQGYEPCGRCKP